MLMRRESYMPDGMIEPNWYKPTDRGLEGQISEKLKQLTAVGTGKRGRKGNK
jgi:putative ATPase